MNILESKNLYKTYTINHAPHHVLKDINIQIRQGEFLSIMGPSGCGKSTLMYNISGMDKMSSGSVTFNEQELSDLSQKDLAVLRLHKMGFIFQQIHLLKNLNILDNVIVPGYMAGRKNRLEINSKALELMEKAGIRHLANNEVSQASGGQLQRVAICRALINNPQIIYGDEPTGALNSNSAAEIMEMLRKINDSGTTIMLVTHDAKIASKTERVIFMIDGQIVDELHLGKYNAENMKERERCLSKWLLTMGF